MKRILAAILCLLLTAGVATVLTACGGNNNDIALAEFPNLGPGGVEGVNAPANATFIPFATLDDDDNVTVLGLVDLFSRQNVRVTLDDRSVITLNRRADELRGGEERIMSITAHGHEVLVSVMEEDGVRTLYARGWIAGSENDPYTIHVDMNRPPLETRPVGTVATVPTTHRTTTTQDLMWEARRNIENSGMSAQEQQRAFRMLSYRMDGNGVFYTERDPWQKQFGFNALFDMASPFLQMVYGTIRLNFRYGYLYDIYQEGPNRNRVRYDASGNPIYLLDENGNRIPKDWLIQLWKGRYGLAMLGAEIGVYTKDARVATQHFFSAVEEEYVIMTIQVFQHDFQTGRTQHLFNRGPHPTWWITGFVPGAFHEPERNNRGKSEIIVVGTLTFPSPQMMNLVANAWVAAGFREINAIPTHLNPETLTRRGNSIHYSWQYMDQDVPSHRRGRPS